MAGGRGYGRRESGGGGGGGGLKGVGRVEVGEEAIGPFAGGEVVGAVGDGGEFMGLFGVQWWWQWW